MHYYVDGYNLLFYLFDNDKPLKSQRDELIEIINETAQSNHMRITIVFDAHYYTEGNIRTHFDNVEIIYTDFEESADEYILDAVCLSSKPGSLIVVTHDRPLSRMAKKEGAQVESLPKFLKMLHNRGKRQKKIKKQEKKRVLPPLKIKIEGSVDYYLEKFLERMDEDRID